MIHQTIFDNFAKENAMELDRYRALVCAIETGSLSTAAEALQYTPSGVSRMVAALEEETGVPLLLREHSGVRPTKECEKLLPVIRDLLHAGESCAQLSAQLRGLDVGTVTVGTAYSAFYSPLARIISDFHARYGGIQVQLRGGYSTELITQLNAHQLDLCFISAREGGHDRLPIDYDELTAWVPAAHPMACCPRCRSRRSPKSRTSRPILTRTSTTRADRRFGYAAIPLAVLLAFSRLYLYVHFPSDVFAGAVLGLVIGELVSRYASKLFQKRG